MRHQTSSSARRGGELPMNLFTPMWDVPAPELQPRFLGVALTDDAVGVVHALGQEMRREVALQDFI